MPAYIVVGILLGLAGFIATLSAGYSVWTGGGVYALLGLFAAASMALFSGRPERIRFGKPFLARGVTPDLEDRLFHDMEGRMPVGAPASSVLIVAKDPERAKALQSWSQDCGANAMICPDFDLAVDWIAENSGFFDALIVDVLSFSMEKAGDFFLSLNSEIPKEAIIAIVPFPSRTDEAGVWRYAHRIPFGKMPLRIALAKSLGSERR